MTDWQDIEVAPKDGASILVWDGTDQMVVEWHRGNWLFGWDRSGGPIRLVRPLTHWKPLGPSPENTP